MISSRKILTRKIWLSFLGLSFFIATFLIISSCSNDEAIDEATYNIEKEAKVSLNIYAIDEDGFKVSRADDNSEEGEFISTLCVFIVNEDGIIERKLLPDLSNDSDAIEGNLEAWSSYTTLELGEKTIYAFANWETVDNDNWEQLIEKEEGDELLDNELNFLIDDPAGKIDIGSKKFIPMSAKLLEQVTTSSQNISIGLDRLVGKVFIDINSEKEEDLIAALSFSGLADKVSLILGDTSLQEDITFDKKKEVDVDVTLTQNEDVRIASFYVNETIRETDGFTISLNTNLFGGLDYTATTQTKEIPRNHIYLLTLNLDNYELQLTPRAWTTVLGYVGELEYTEPIYFTDNTYYITMLDVTSTFEITPSLVNNSNEFQDVSWEWTPQNNDDETKYTYSSNGVLSVTSLTATIGYEYSFILKAQWSPEAGALNQRSYNVKVIFIEGFPTFYRLSRAWKSLHYQNELVNLRSRK